MAQVTFKFNLDDPDDRFPLDCCQRSQDMHQAIMEFSNWLRLRDDTEEDLSVDEVTRAFWEILGDADVASMFTSCS